MRNTKKVLLTGGAGYVGSHTALEIIAAGYEVVIVDDLSNSDLSVIDRIEQISGIRPAFYLANVADRGSIEKVFANHDIDAVLHFAGYKAVGESVEKPLAYYRNNLGTTLSLLEAMQKYSVKRFIFSSSATVYSLAEGTPFAETSQPLGCTNPYGWTKYMIEQILRDQAAAAPDFSVVLLRYFNPVGAHSSGLLGEKPNGIPNNLMPYIAKVAKGELPFLKIFGDDYPTPDGTGVRDYIHVVDLASGHLAALKWCERQPGCEVFNLGTGRGYSVLDMVRSFEEVNGVKVPYRIVGRRTGDIAECYADTTKAQTVLGWKAIRGIEEMCRDAWRWECLQRKVLYSDDEMRV